MSSLLRHEESTDQELKAIIFWNGNARDLISYIQQIWSWPTLIKCSGKKVLYFELHTGGLSEHEDIIRTLERTIFWSLFWEKTVRGGHYYFKITKPDVKLCAIDCDSTN
jgi:hypothetical protein